MTQTELFKGFRIHEMQGNTSQLITRPNPVKGARDLETFDSLDDASEYLEDRVNGIIRDVYSLDSLYQLSDTELEAERELQFSYYSIEEIN